MSELFDRIGRILKGGPSKEELAAQLEAQQTAERRRLQEIQEKQRSADYYTEAIKKAVQIDEELMQKLKKEYPPDLKEFDNFQEAKRIGESVSEIEIFGKFPKGTDINGHSLRSVSPVGGSYIYPTVSIVQDHAYYGSENIHNILQKQVAPETIKDTLLGCFPLFFDTHYRSSYLIHTNGENPNESIASFILGTGLGDVRGRRSPGVVFNFLLPKDDIYKLLLLAEKDPKAINTFFWTATHGAEGDKDKGIPDTGIYRTSETVYLDLSRIRPEFLNTSLKYNQQTKQFGLNEPYRQEYRGVLKSIIERGYQENSGNPVKVFRYGERDYHHPLHDATQKT